MTGDSYPVPFINPKTGKSETRDLIPDALFGLEYRKGSRKSYRFFLVEADRGTEPTRASRFNRKSHLRNFLQYREYVGRGLYKDHLGLTAGLLVLNVTLFPKTAEAMMKLLIELNSNGNSYQLFRTLDGNGISPVKPIGLDSDMLTGWQRAGHEPFHLV